MSFTNPALGSLPTVSGLVFVGPSAAEMGDSAFGIHRHHRAGLPPRPVDRPHLHLT